jgi:hypothetical protein
MPREYKHCGCEKKLSNNFLLPPLVAAPPLFAFRALQMERKEKLLFEREWTPKNVPDAALKAVAVLVAFISGVFFLLYIKGEL